jgi:nucleotide-binding universal stress UspA family protein
MDRIKNILVPVDFSTESYCGLRAANSFAQKFEGKVHLVHFLLPTDNVKDLDPKQAVLDKEDELRQDQLGQESQQALTELKSISERTLAPSVQGEVFAVASNISKSFEEFMKETEMDLVISGTSGSRNIFEFFKGNRTENILQDADVPLLVVSNHGDLYVDDIMIATDLGKEIPFKSLEICKFFQANGAKLHFVNVIATKLITEEEVKEKIENLAGKAGIEGYETYIIRDDKEFDGIMEVIKEIKPGLVLMKTYAKSQFWTFIVGSLTEKVMRETEIPVLAENV